MELKRGLTENDLAPCCPRHILKGVKLSYLHRSGTGENLGQSSS